MPLFEKKTDTDSPEATLPSIGRAYEVVASEWIDEVNGTATILRHTKSGAEVLTIQNDDNNKVFSIMFRTPSGDSTGIAHILEHTVLCGSERYPIKDPFMAISKGSINTFLNAWTDNDNTCYPLASTSGPDLLNQAGIYLDAVLKPRLDEEAFLQEGWRYEVNEEDKLTYNGVVFNEMKGVYSDPASVLDEDTAKAIFPDIFYSGDAGGRPEIIPQLTYEAFKNFHKKYYHPSNSLIVLTGNFDRQESLKLLDERLSEFDAENIEVDLPLQPAFDAPRERTGTYPASEGDENCYATVNWVLPEFTDQVEKIGFDVLDHVLLMMPSSPLKRVALESGLGEGLAARGVREDFHQAVFSFGLTGVKEEDCKPLTALVTETFERLATEGLDRKDIEGALNEVEFRLCENDSPYPQGFTHMEQAARKWLYGKNPLEGLKYQEALVKLKKQIANDPEYFQKMIKKHFVDNTHRAAVYLKPDSELPAKEKEKEDGKLAEIQAGLSEAELDSIKEVQARVRAYQEKEDKPEDLATIPRLEMSEIEKSAEALPVSVQKTGEAETILYPLNTQGIVYANLGFDLSSLPQELLPYTGIFGKLCTELGTTAEDHISFSQRISATTGGIKSWAELSEHISTGEPVMKLFLKGKAMADKTEDLFSLLRAASTEMNLDHIEKFKQIVLEEKAAIEESILSNGHTFVSRRLSAHFSPDATARDLVQGFGQLAFIRDLAERMDSDWDTVRAELETFKNLVFNSDRLVCGLTASDEDLTRSGYFLEQLVSGLPAEGLLPVNPIQTIQTAHEGISAPSKVNYVGKGIVIPGDGDRFSGVNAVVKLHLNRTWLWDEVRVKGGAYGARVSFDPDSGMLAFASYRDPNLLQTLDVYDKTAAHLLDLNITPEQLKGYKIGVISDEDMPELPDDKCCTAISRQIVGLTDEKRQAFRDQIFSTTEADFRSFGEKMADLKDDGHVVVLGSEESLTELKTAVPDLKQIKGL